MSIDLAQELSFNEEDFEIEESDRTERRLSDLEGFFADEEAYKAALAKDNPIIYHVQGVSPANGEGDLNYGLGTLMPGKIGKEYYLTKGHLHSWREAAEVYIGLEGTGMMLLEEEQTGKTKTFPLEKNSIVYVPGYVAHRTVNCGNIPLKYIGIFPASAGHDYGAIAERNFNSVIAEIDNQPKLLKRKNFLSQYV